MKTYRIMEEYVKKGKLKSIGLSNFYGKNLDNILKNCKIKPVLNQIETHVMRQHLKLKDLYKKENIYIESWGPLGQSKGNILNNQTLLNISKKYNKTVAQICLRFFIQENVIVIPKSVHVERMKENLEVFDFKINDDDMNTIRNLNKDQSFFSGWFPNDY